MYKQLTSAALFVAGVSAHGRVTSPTPRPLGTAMESACGNQVYNQMSSDPNGNIQTMAQVGASQSDFSATECHLWQCRGYQFADATSTSIQSYSAGEVIPVVVDIAAPHTGVANVSVINLAENSVVSELASWSVYASTATGVTANETSFSITMPDTLPDACATSGGCAIQWWWDARSIDQTYMSCIDFTFSGSTSGSSSSSSSSSGSSSASSAAASGAATAAASSAPSAASSAVVSSSSAASSTLATSTVPATSSAAAAATSSAAATANNASGSDDTSDSGSTSTCSKKRKARRAAREALRK